MKLSDSGFKEYLNSPASPGLYLLFLFVAFYRSSFAGGGTTNLAVSTLVLLAVLTTILGMRRLFLYLILLTAILLSVWNMVFSVAEGVQDSMADRDEQTEIAAKSFLAGRNPWEQPTSLGSQVTTGPAGVLAAIPFVKIFGRMNELTMLFWLALFFSFLVSDIRFQNNSFPLVCSLYLLGVLFIYETQYWALEELYFPFLFLILAWVLAERRKLLPAGLSLGVPIMARANYIFLAFSFLCWLFTRAEYRRADMLRILGGVAMCVILILAPFYFVEREQFLKPFSTAYAVSLQTPAQNIVATGLESALSALPEAVRSTAKVVFCLALLALFSVVMKKFTFSHPFWHVALAGWIAHALVWPSKHFLDYPLMFVIPGLLAIANTER